MSVSIWRKTIVATALVGAGFASTTGAAFAGENTSPSDDSSSSSHEGHEKGGHEKGGHEKGGHEKGQDKKNAGGCETDVKGQNGGGGAQSGLLNVDDVQTIVPTNVCGNDVPVNVLGVQVPIQDSTLNVPVLSPTDDGGNTSSVAG